MHITFTQFIQFSSFITRQLFYSSFPQLFAAKSKEAFIPHLPIVSRVLTVSTSIFDDVEVPVISESFTYDFCGLRFRDFAANQDKATVMQRHILDAVQEIEKHEGTQQTADIFGKFLPNTIMEDMFRTNNNRLEFNKKQLFNILGKLSSGESNLVITFCDIIAKLRQDTLLLKDEPETHLHPKAITKMSSLRITSKQQLSLTDFSTSCETQRKVTFSIGSSSTFWLIS